MTIMKPFNQAMLSHLNRQLGDDAEIALADRQAALSVDYIDVAGRALNDGLDVVSNGLRTLFSWNPDSN
jgi:uncharacterized NAD-dependent epimerase/dehydratase family protein